jgi:RNAse (barnase) inhibitor barstar
MKIIKLDATNWTDPVDFYDAVDEALRAPYGVSRNLNALLEVMIWDDNFARIRPPYRIQISGTAGLSEDVIDVIKVVQSVIPSAIAEYRVRRGTDIEVSFETDIKT